MADVKNVKSENNTYRSPVPKKSLEVSLLNVMFKIRLPSKYPSHFFSAPAFFKDDINYIEEQLNYFFQESNRTSLDHTTPSKLN